jgi:hypothetical protein
MTCTICGSAYHPHRHDYLEVCQGCIPNLRAQAIHDPPDSLHVDDDLATRLLLEQAIDEAQRHGQIQARGPRLLR